MTFKNLHSFMHRVTNALHFFLNRFMECISLMFVTLTPPTNAIIPKRARRWIEAKSSTDMSDSRMISSTLR